MPPLNILIKPASSLCNMSCDYCFYCDESQKREHSSYGLMSEDTLKNVIRKTLPRASGSITYAFQGGEPLLQSMDFYEKVIHYQSQYNINNIPVHNALQTNGYIIDDAWCRFFKVHNFLIGVSVDGTPDIHNTYRHTRSGEETYSRILQSIDLLAKHGVDFNILTVVTRDIASRIEEVYTHYKQQKWNYQQYIVCLDPLNEGHQKESYALTPELYGDFLCRLFSLWFSDLKKNRQPYIRQFENYVGIAAGFAPESCDQNGICSIQHVVEADGSVYPCDFFVLDEYKLGNFNEHRLDIIDKNRLALGFVQRSLQLDPACRQCPYYRLCRGGCQRNRDFDPASGFYQNYFCPSYRMFFERHYADILKIASYIR